MLHSCMSWTPANSIGTRAAHPSRMRVLSVHRESTDLPLFCREGSDLVGKDSSRGSVRLFSRPRIPLSPFFSTFAHRLSKDRPDARAHFRRWKWAYSAQFWGNVTPFRINTCKSVSKQRTSTTFRMNTYEKTRGVGGLILTFSSIIIVTAYAPLAGGALSGVN